MTSATATLPASGLRTPMLLCGALTIGLLAQLALPGRPAPAVAVTPRASHAATPALAPIAPTPDYPAILVRPLFSPGRSSVAGATAAATQGAFALLGVASAGGRASAVLRAGDGGLHTLRLGEALDGWRLVAVGVDRAALRRDGRVQDLRIGTAR